MIPTWSLRSGRNRRCVRTRRPGADIVVGGEPFHPEAARGFDRCWRRSRASASAACCALRNSAIVFGVAHAVSSWRERVRRNVARTARRLALRPEPRTRRRHRGHGDTGGRHHRRRRAARRALRCGPPTRSTPPVRARRWRLRERGCRLTDAAPDELRAARVQPQRRPRPPAAAAASDAATLRTLRAQRVRIVDRVTGESDATSIADGSAIDGRAARAARTGGRRHDAIPRARPLGDAGLAFSSSWASPTTSRCRSSC